LGLDRLFDVVGVSILFLTGIAASAGPAMGARPVVLVFAGGLGLFCLLALAARFPDRVRSGLARPWVPGPFRRAAGSVVDGAGALRHPKRIAAAFACTAATWGLILSVFYGAARVFGLSLSLGGAAWLVTGLALGVALPSTPGYVGTYEAAGVAALGLLDVEKARALPFIVLVHVGQILGAVLWGAPGVLLLNRSGEARDGTRPGHAQPAPELLKSDSR